MARTRLLYLALGAFGIALCLLLAQAPGSVAPRPVTYRSPVDVAFSPDGSLLAVSDHTAGALVLVDPATGKQVRQVALHGRPACVAWGGAKSPLFVAEYGAGTVAEVDPGAGKVVRRLKVGSLPVGVAVAPKQKLLLVGNLSNDNVSLIDLGTGKERTRVRVVRQPYFITVTPDESLALVGNLLPLGDASDPQTSAVVSVIDLAKKTRVTDIRLPAGATAVRKIVVSPDGKWAYVVHTLGHTTLPTTQLDRGWINTNALSIIDVAKKKLYGTVLLDRVSEGAADPWGEAISKDGNTLWVTIAGCHQVARIDLAGLHKLMAGMDNEKRQALSYDLAALVVADVLTRTGVPCNGPRGIALSPDGKQLAVAGYFTENVLLLDPTSLKANTIVMLAPKREPDRVRRGERVFHDGTLCFQHWLSCATCHPDGRVDALNWDLLNDGIGNPKNNRSMVNAWATGPMMTRGVREDMGEAVLAGFHFIEFVEPDNEDVLATRAYITSLRPEKSPYLVNGQLSASAKRGKALFDSKAVGCSSCHSGPYFMDHKTHDVGTIGPMDKGAKFVTAPLIECWRTAPYLGYGQALTIQEVLTKFNKGDKHGHTSQLTKQQIDDLATYVLSL